MRIFNIIIRIKAMARNYIRFDRWILIEKDLSDEITIVPTKTPMQISMDSFSETIEYIRQTFYDKDLDEEEKRELEYAKKYGHFYPNINKDGKIIGFQKIGINELYVRSLRKNITLLKNIMFELSVFIDPNHRHKGLGNQLLKCSLRMAKEKGFQYVRAHVSPKNLGAIKLHSKCGFYEIARFWHIRLLSWDFVAKDIGKLKSAKRRPLAVAQK